MYHIRCKLLPRVLIILLVITAGLLLAQSSSRLRTDQKKELENLQREIQQYRQKLAEAERKELSTLEKVARLERSIDLTRQLIQKLRVQELQTRKIISQLNQELLDLSGEFQKLKQQYARQLVSYYKHQGLKDWEILLTAKSFNQVYVWLKYRQRIIAANRRRLETLLKKKQLIEQKSEQLHNELQYQRKIIKEKKAEQAYLLRDQHQRKQILKKLRRDKKILQEKIKEYQAAAVEIQRLIERSERERLITTKGRTKVSHFPKLRGRMIWPTTGRVISHFGKVKNRQLGTVVENLGIDIKAPFGADVRATADGVISAITWQRGRGNILIVNHYGGYYTVYAHLSDILVTVGQEVVEGEVIAKVGDSGSLSGPMLHFEIWENTQNVDPEKWLAKR